MSGISCHRGISPLRCKNIWKFTLCRTGIQDVQSEITRWKWNMNNSNDVEIDVFYQ